MQFPTCIFMRAQATKYAGSIFNITLTYPPPADNAPELKPSRLRYALDKCNYDILSGYLKLLSPNYGAVFNEQNS